MNDILSAMEKRSSTRSYTAEKLTDAEVEKLLRAGLQAPTARNEQEIHISVVDGGHPILAEIEAEKNAQIKNPTRPGNFYYSAPLVLILSADRDCPWSAVDAGIAVENISLAAEGMGLGSVIIGIIKGAMSGGKKEYFSQKLKFPENYEFEIAIAIGHKAAEKEPHEYDMEKNISYL